MRSGDVRFVLLILLVTWSFAKEQEELTQKEIEALIPVARRIVRKFNSFLN